jgi:hypothetical protein
MKCSKHPERDAAGMCAYSGKPFCSEDLVEIYGKMVAKDNLEKFMEEQKKVTGNEKKSDTPMVFMNAGGGASAASASSSGPRGGFLKGATCFDWVMVFLTGGLWLIWMIVRPSRY